MSAKHYQVVDDIKVSEFHYVPLYRVANVDHGFFGIIFTFLRSHRRLHRRLSVFHTFPLLLIVRIPQIIFLSAHKSHPVSLVHIWWHFLCCWHPWLKGERPDRHHLWTETCPLHVQPLLFMPQTTNSESIKQRIIWLANQQNWKPIRNHVQRSTRVGAIDTTCRILQCNSSSGVQ